MTDRHELNAIKDFLLARKETIAVAESVTAGFLQAAFSLASEAMQFFHGGITVYNAGQKYRHLGIDPIYAMACSSVSERVSREMALNVCRLFSSDWGIGITGFASPVPESGNQLFAYYAIALKGKIVKEDKMTAAKDDPEKVQQFYVRQVMNELAKLTKQDLPSS